jgi:hypothetical protein
MRLCVIAAAGVIFGLTGTSLANTLDSPGTVYIDGVACNSPCQAYMDWSRRTLKANQTSAKDAADVSDVKRQAPRKRISKHVEPALPDKPQRKKAGDVQAALSSKPPEPAPLPVPRSVPLDREAPAATAAIAPDPAPLPVPRPLNEGSARNDESSSSPAERTPQELVMAALAVAEQMMGAAPPRATSDDEVKADAAVPPSARNADRLVAVLIARPDVTSAAALKDQNVAIDKASEHEADIRFALIAAGATGAELSATDDGALDRVVRGDVPAAVLKLVSPEAAEAFPDVKGLNVLRIPLTPHQSP